MDGAGVGCVCVGRCEGASYVGQMQRIRVGVAGRVTVAGRAAVAVAVIWVAKQMALVRGVSGWSMA